ncbi:Translation initiation factor 3 subunit J component [Pleurotus pulmonarius]|nr:Translation initiation factor 3 subunit J component [Pleurotus pulmonarius]KAF4596215.1 Translation initiation factor 3 subunit J component [Pleurotus pulmonarius]KAF4597637.1 Translation initiation factor 3 subunit J component [Pleurotus pulmonarius]
MSDWEGSEDEKPAKQPVVVKKAKKWEGEDEEESEPASDWEESSEEEEEKPAAAPVAPPKKKGTLKAKLAEKEAAKAARIAAGEDDDVDYDEDEVLDPREKARRDKEREVNADLNNAAELFGAAALGGTSSAELDSIISFQPRTKEDFHTLSSRIIEYTIKRHQNKPLYAAFVEHHVRQLAMPLKDVEIRKAASGLTTLANEKQKEQREKASGKKKPKAATKPALGAAKASNKLDTNLYDESLDDFGTNPDDFM